MLKSKIRLAVTTFVTCLISQPKIPQKFARKSTTFFPKSFVSIDFVKLGFHMKFFVAKVSALGFLCIIPPKAKCHKDKSKNKFRSKRSRLPSCTCIKTNKNENKQQTVFLGHLKLFPVSHNLFFFCSETQEYSCSFLNYFHENFRSTKLKKEFLLGFHRLFFKVSPNLLYGL